MREIYIDDKVYVSPLMSFRKGSREDKKLMDKWKQHFTSLGIEILEHPNPKGDGTFELLVNKEDNDRAWNSPCVLAICDPDTGKKIEERSVNPPHPHFGFADFVDKTKSKMGEAERKHLEEI